MKRELRNAKKKRERNFLISLEVEWKEGKIKVLIGQERTERWMERNEGQRSPCLGSLPWAC